MFYQAANLADYEKWMHLCVKLAVDQYGKENPVGHLRRILFHCDSPGEQEKFLQDPYGLRELCLPSFDPENRVIKTWNYRGER